MTRVASLFSYLFVAQAALAGAANAQSTAKPLDFRPGNPKQAAMLAKVPDAREIVAEAFSLAFVDLDGDGKNEIVLRSDSSAFCGSGGCLTVVLQQRGNQMATLLSQNLFPDIGVTDQKFGAYRALAALDGKGGIEIGDKPGTPLHGKRMVYPMLAQAVNEPAAASGRPSTVTASGTRPDILGIKVGATGVAEAKAALAALSPRLVIDENFTQLRGQATRNRGISQFMEIEGGRFLSSLHALTTGFRTQCSSSTTSDCDQLRVHFSGPPAAGTAVAVSRHTFFHSGATVETVIKGLTAKYGRPGYFSDYAGRGIEFDLAWAWSPDGSSLPMKDGHPCAHRNAAFLRNDANGQLQQAELVLQSRCAVILHVTLGAANSIVSSMVMTLADHASIRDTTSKTIDFVTGYVANQEQRQRDSAAKAAAPKF